MRKIIIRIEDDIPEGEALLMVHSILHSEPKDNGKKQKEDLFKIYWKRLAKRLSNGLAEWYDNKLNEPDEDDDEDFLKDVPYVSFSNEEIRNMKEDHPFYKYIKHLKE